LGQEVAFGRPVVVMGQTLVLDPAGQVWLAFVFGLAAIYYLLAWRIPQGRSYFAFNLVILAIYALVVLLEPLALSVIAFAISATLAVFVIQAGQPASVRGAQRYLLVTLLAVPMLLAASWFLEQSLLSVEVVSGVTNAADLATTAGLADALLRRALLLAALGFGLLLAAFPFSTWMPTLAADGPPLVTAFFFTAGQGMALYLAFSFFRAAPAVLEDPAVLIVIQLAALGMAISGGIMAAAQRDLGRLFGYAALSDLGVVLLALNAGGSRAIDLTLLHMIARGLSITLMAAAIGILRHRSTNDSFSELGGLARRLPVATAALIVGGLGLAGLPLTPGFATHWAVGRAVWNWAYVFAPGAAGSGIETIPGQEWVWAITLVALLASSVGVVIGVLRALGAMAGFEPRDDVAPQPVLASLLLLSLIAFGVVLGLRPQIFAESVSTAVRALSLF
jgi:formate hydrogenlyase subunit 3/multisubunit Na+/H+ antiporter MnhD subunit